MGVYNVTIYTERRKQQRTPNRFQRFIWRFQGLFVPLHPQEREPAKPLNDAQMCGSIYIRVPAKHTTRTAGGSFFSFPLTKNAYLRKNSK
jgi:hypothetical protein